MIGEYFIRIESFKGLYLNQDFVKRVFYTSSNFLIAWKLEQRIVKFFTKQRKSGKEIQDSLTSAYQFSFEKRTIIIQEGAGKYVQNNSLL